ncbi:complex III assembly factor LYRM7 [Stegostoma tigrinum]|uniref:complex III assembly factor LYRM7 n=1 Tax=Stegostoma tigrinum TaxID=3053191 RepID=UPI00287030F0|nr:complex III assembly factor LYRM7 [Stegostoma tigrinum]
MQRQETWLKIASGQTILANVLQLFKALHRTRKEVFKGDDDALEVFPVISVILIYGIPQNVNIPLLRLTIYYVLRLCEYRCKLLKFGTDVEIILREMVIQGVHTDHNRISIKPRKEILLDNVPFNHNPTIKDI